jgi:hypothetical protein
MQESNNVKMQVYCPEDAANKVRMAIGDAGGGHIGNYSHCAFVTKGKGYFLPLDGSNPTIGEQGKLEKVDEVKIEFICPKDKVKDVMQSIERVHPYEEYAVDVLPMMEV